MRVCDVLGEQCLVEAIGCIREERVVVLFETVVLLLVTAAALCHYNFKKCSRHINNTSTASRVEENDRIEALCHSLKML